MTRGKDLIDLRNKAIYQRYKELTEIKHLRFDYVVKTLSKEFYLSEYRIMAIIRDYVRKM